jgi:hypothetical protein
MEHGRPTWCFVFDRQEHYKREDLALAELIFAQSRNGPLGAVRLH